MMATGHALSGFVVGAGLANASGLDVAPACAAGVITAGYALLPDLDCDGSTAYRVGGWLSAAVGETLQALSAFAFRHTATARDVARDRSGQHRHLTHTPCFSTVLGLLVTVACLAGGPWPVAGVLLLGVALAHAALDRRRFKLKPPRGTAQWMRHVYTVVRTVANNPAVAAFLVPVGVIVAASPDTGNPVDGVLVAFAQLAPWTGVAVGGGCVVHILGDWLTYSGVPLLWPIVWRGERWYRFRSPAPFLAGGRFERAAVWPLLLAGSIAVVPGSVPMLADAAVVLWSSLSHLTDGSG